MSHRLLSTPKVFVFIGDSIFCRFSNNVMSQLMVSTQSQTVNHPACHLILEYGAHLSSSAELLTPTERHLSNSFISIHLFGVCWGPPPVYMSSHATVLASSMHIKMGWLSLIGMTLFFTISFLMVTKILVPVFLLTTLSISLHEQMSSPIGAIDSKQDYDPHNGGNY